ncbi:hypothetical protein V2W30_02315 [Streptomyces sp. Q6]|uniref:Uncharacterized protein n=1 Tax=Streptomyces citrinus TaxID=3118173 RepID=A0ACD5A5N2_9ACTN
MTLIVVAMILGAFSVACIVVTARQVASDDIAIGPPVAALIAAFASAGLMLLATALGH